MATRAAALNGAQLFRSSPEEAQQIFAYVEAHMTPQDPERVDVSSVYPFG
jgi:hypothetical protein